MIDKNRLLNLLLLLYRLFRVPNLLFLFQNIKHCFFSRRDAVVS